MSEVDELKEKIAEYEQKFGIGEHDPAKEAYIVYVDQLRQQTKYLKGFKLETKIGSAIKDDPVYARSMELVEKMPKTIESVMGLQEKFGVVKKEQDEAFVDSIAKTRA